jgi:hypothetical protein
VLNPKKKQQTRLQGKVFNSKSIKKKILRTIFLSLEIGPSSLGQNIEHIFHRHGHRICNRHGDVWKSTSSTEVSMPIQFLGSRFGGHRYFSLRIPTRRILYVCRGQTVMDRVVQFQQEDRRQRLAWDPGIAGLSSSLTDRGEWTIAGESYSNFPFSTTLEGASRRSCSTSFWHHHVQLMETMWILVEIWRMESF